MIKLTITENEDHQRLDRFCKKYFKNAPLSHIYKLIRKDVKVNGKRVTADTVLQLGDELSIYITQEEADVFTKRKKIKAMRQFQIAYEDKNILIVEKPFGLLTHGDRMEKKNHLTNQVSGYLAEKGEYLPGREKTFSPAPVNRLDRNTTGLVIFGKNNHTLQTLNQMIREKGFIRKFYLTVVAGNLNKELVLTDKMEKDHAKNIVQIAAADGDVGKLMETIARPLEFKKGYTLVEVEIVTGRTHQIRAHLASAGYPIIGDAKYGARMVNREIEKRFGLSTQFLHAYKLIFVKAKEPIAYMSGKEIISSLPDYLKGIKESLF